VYDLVILAPATLLISDWVLSLCWTPPSEQFVVLLYLVYLLPLLGILTKWTHVQLSVIAMSILLWLIWREGDSRREAPARMAS
jgi:hypothetical protein